MTLRKKRGGGDETPQQTIERIRQSIINNTPAPQPLGIQPNIQEPPREVRLDPEDVPSREVREIRRRTGGTRRRKNRKRKTRK